MSGKRCRGCHLWGYQVCAPAIALPALEIAVGGGGATLARLELIGVHTQTHRAACLAPFKTGIQEDVVEPLLFGLLFHQTRTRHDHGIVQSTGDFLALHDLGHGAQVLDAPVRAGSYPDHVEGNLGHFCTRRQAHVVERARHFCTLDSSATLAGSGTIPSMVATSSGEVPQVTIGGRRVTSSFTSRAKCASASECKVRQ